MIRLGPGGALRIQVAAFCIAHAAVGQACPSGMVAVTSSVCIDKYEWIGFNMTPPARPFMAFSGKPEPDGSPFVHDAEATCQMQQKRVCTLQEWQAACRGPGASKYPYGDTYDPGACNTNKTWRSFDEVKVWRRDEAELRKLDQSDPVGFNRRCISAAGAYDMIGNAEEWVRCDHGKYGWCLAGGFWAHPQTCNDAIIVHSPYWHFYQTSFRCCADLSLQQVQ